jgi:hypothetical protein
MPQRLMMKPAMRPPTGVPSDGMISLMPAVEADSVRTTWKKSGIVKRNCLMISVVRFWVLSWNSLQKQTCHTKHC